MKKLKKICRINWPYFQELIEVGDITSDRQERRRKVNGYRCTADRTAGRDKFPQF